jgi:hypothetical protein
MLGGGGRMALSGIVEDARGLVCGFITLLDVAGALQGILHARHFE